jgi:hypothetical protein
VHELHSCVTASNWCSRKQTSSKKIKKLGGHLLSEVHFFNEHMHAWFMYLPSFAARICELD